MVPSHFHVAAAWHGRMHFVEAEVEGRFRALERCLAPLGLAEASRAVELGRVYECGAPNERAYEPAALVLPVSDPVLRIALALALGETIGFLGFMLIRINRLIQLRLGRYLALCLAVFAAVYALAWGAGWPSSQVIPPEGALGFTLSIALLLGLMLPPILGAGYWMNRRRHIGKAG